MSILAIYKVVVVVVVVVVVYESAMNLYKLEYEEKIFNEIRLATIPSRLATISSRLATIPSRLATISNITLSHLIGSHYIMLRILLLLDSHYYNVRFTLP